MATIPATAPSAPVSTGGLSYHDMMVRVWRELPGAELPDFIAVCYQQLQILAGRNKWTWLEEEYEFDLTAATTTLVVTVTEGDATVLATTGSFTSAMEGQKFRVDANGKVYTIETYTDATHVELDRAWADDTSTLEECTIFQDTYDVPIDVRRISRVRNMSQSVNLTPLTSRNRYETSIDQWQTYPVSDPTHYTLYGFDSTYLRQMIFDAAAVSADRIRLEYWRRPQLSLSVKLSDEPDCPEWTHELLLAMTVLQYLPRAEGTEKLQAKWEKLENRLYTDAVRSDKNQNTVFIQNKNRIWT